VEKTSAVRQTERKGRGPISSYREGPILSCSVKTLTAAPKRLGLRLTASSIEVVYNEKTGDHCRSEVEIVCHPGGLEVDAGPTRSRKYRVRSEIEEGIGLWLRGVYKAEGI